MVFLLKKCVKFCNIFIKSNFFKFGYHTACITDYEALLLSLDQIVAQLSTTFSLNMISRSKINCGHCDQLNTVEYALSNHWTAGHPMSNHWTDGHAL